MFLIFKLTANKNKIVFHLFVKIVLYRCRNSSAYPAIVYSDPDRERHSCLNTRDRHQHPILPRPLGLSLGRSLRDMPL